MPLALVGAKIIDGNGGSPIPGGTIVVDGGKIVEVTQQREFGSEVHLIDVSGKTVMPGLIDTHQHFALWGQYLISQQKDSLMHHACTTAYALKGALEAGCTTSRDLGGLEAGFCTAVAKGFIPGPRLQTALVIIQPTNGLTDWLPGIGGAITPQGLTTTIPGIPLPWCDGPDQVQAKVREVLRYGAQVIKIANTGIPKPWYRPDRQLFTRAELDVAVDEAHRAGVQVSCHCTGVAAGTLDAVRAGVDIIDHGFPMTEEIAEEMAKRGTWLVPTISNAHFHATRNRDEEMRKYVQHLLEVVVPETMRLAIKAGVRIAMGTDSAYAVGEVGVELKHMVDAGMSPAQAIEASTRRAAEMMRMNDMVGTLEPGREADLLVVDGDPLNDIAVLSRVESLSLVMQAGKPVAGPMASLFPWECPKLPRFWEQYL